MSYILDALKKAEKERRRGTVPNLSTDQNPSPWKPKKRSLWVYVLIVVLLINAGIFLLWLRPWKSNEPTIIAKGPAVVTDDIHEKVILKESSDIQSQKRTESVLEKNILLSEEKSAQKEISQEVQPTIPPQKTSETQKQEQAVPTPPTKTEDVPGSSSITVLPHDNNTPTDISKAPSPSSTEPPTSDEQARFILPPPEPFRLYDLNSLPVELKERLPDLNISVFVYSDDPSSRVVKINGHTVREGQELTDGLTVEKIVPEGIIFNYEDYRFRVGIR